MSIRGRRYLIPLALLGAATADAQLILRTPTTSTPVLTAAATTPIATVAFAPYSLGSSLGGSPISLGLTGVTITSPASVTLRRVVFSSVTLSTPQGLPNGTYSVQFAFTRVTEPLTLMMSAGTTAQCTLQVALLVTAPAQVCDTGPITVTDGRMLMSLQIAATSANQQGELDLTNITVNRWR